MVKLVGTWTSSPTHHFDNLLKIQLSLTQGVKRYDLLFINHVCFSQRNVKTHCIMIIAH